MAFFKDKAAIATLKMRVPPQGLNWDRKGIFLALKDQQERGIFTDIKFYDSARNVWNGHQCVLDVASPFLRQVFKSNKSASNRASQTEVVFILPDFPGASIERLLQFLYLGFAKFDSQEDKQEVIELLKALGVFQTAPPTAAAKDPPSTRSSAALNGDDPSSSTSQKRFRKRMGPKSRTTPVGIGPRPVMGPKSRMKKPEPPRSPFACTKCQKEFSSRREVEHHLATCYNDQKVTEKKTFLFLAL